MMVEFVLLVILTQQDASIKNKNKRETLFVSLQMVATFVPNCC
jgi:hypothetical protein